MHTDMKTGVCDKLVIDKVESYLKTIKNEFGL